MFLAWIFQMQLHELMTVQGDVMLRALRFMDSMIQRDTMQKAAFLNDLTTFWHKFDDRVLRLKVLFANAAHISAASMALIFCICAVQSFRSITLQKRLVCRYFTGDLVLPFIHWYLADQAANIYIYAAYTYMWQFTTIQTKLCCRCCHIYWKKYGLSSYSSWFCP